MPSMRGSTHFVHSPGGAPHVAVGGSSSWNGHALSAQHYGTVSGVQASFLSGLAS